MKKSRFARSRARHLRLGRRGEQYAVRLLRELGLVVLLRNYRTESGEIDIVARDDDVLCFVEVKSRKRALRDMPAAAVTGAKKKRIVKAAKKYMRELGWPEIAYRYDVVEIIHRRGFLRYAAYHRNAFSEEQPW